MIPNKPAFFFASLLALSVQLNAQKEEVTLQQLQALAKGITLF